MKILAPCLYPDEKPLWYLKQTAARFIIEMIPYGVGKPMLSYFDAKVTNLIETLERLPDDLYLHCDGSDCLLQAHPQAAYNKITKGKGRIVVSGNARCVPFYGMNDLKRDVEAVLRRRAPRGVLFPYCCAGVIMGPRRKLLSALRDIVAMRETSPHASSYGFYNNDQGWWQLLIAEGKHDVVIDYGTSLAVSLNAYRDFWSKIVGGRLVMHTGAIPAIIHCNGPKPKKHIWPRLLEALNLCPCQ